MAEGSMRLDVNVSVRPKGKTGFNTKVDPPTLSALSSCPALPCPASPCLDMTFVHTSTEKYAGKTYKVQIYFKIVKL